jgi:type VI secretion system protein ImpB
MLDSSQKYFERNRPPRVQINCEVEKYGSKIKVDLPFVAGVMADLSGTWDDPDTVPEEHQTARGDMEKREFLEFTSKNLNDRMKLIRPKVVCEVPDTITGKGKLPVELTFENMDSFTPEKVAEQVAPLRKLLEKRRNYRNLLSYFPKSKEARKALLSLYENRDTLKSMMAVPNPDEPETKG